MQARPTIGRVILLPALTMLALLPGCDDGMGQAVPASANPVAQTGHPTETSDDADGADDADDAATPTLQTLQLADVPNLSTYGDIYLAGQPKPEDLKLFQQRGVKTVINLRRASEMAGIPERQTLADLGIAFHQFGTRRPESFTDELLDQTRALLRDPANRPLLLHCSSANRVGPVWIAYRVLDEGVAFDEALDEAKQIGLRTESYIPVVKAYVEKKQAERR